MASSSQRAIYAALLANCLIAALKFAAALFTGSSAMLSEGIHSVVDTGNEVLLLYGLRQARLPADEKFPFGHGKEIYFWSFAVALLIFAAGAGSSIFKGISQLVSPIPTKDLYLNYFVIALAGAFEGGSWYVGLREFNKTKGRWGYAQAVHRGKDSSILVVLFEDSAALLSLVAAFLGIFLSHLTGRTCYDGAASIVIGLILTGTALLLASETKDLLMGESANSEVEQGIRAIAAGFKEISHVNEIVTLQMGPDFILALISVDFVDPILADEIEATVDRLDGAIKNSYPLVRRVFVEAEARRVRAFAVQAGAGI
jgi:cation diffusion facilitator family transporter